MPQRTPWKTYARFLPVFVFFIPLLMSRHSELVLFPTAKKYDITTYIDTADSQGNSVARVTNVTDSSIIFDFTLHKVHGDPFAGFSINLLKTDGLSSIHGEPYAGYIVNRIERGGFADISTYDSVCVEMISKQASFFDVHLKTFINNITDTNDLSTCHTMTCRVPIDLNHERYSMPIGDFSLAPWWDKWAVKKFGVLFKSLPRKPDYSKLFGIGFQGGAENPENTPLRFCITKIAFVKKSGKAAVVAACGACAVLYVIVVLLFSMGIQQQRVAPAPVTALHGSPGPDGAVRKEDGRDKQTPEDDGADPHPAPPALVDLEYKQLESFILKNYTNSDLTLEHVARGVSISAPRITKILQQVKNMTFPQYLNDARVCAAKKLLVTTELFINDIGYNVGYNNIPHFNRVFGKIVGSSPGEYREKNTPES
jgi:AraC-like DNA-binding protein